LLFTILYAGDDAGLQKLRLQVAECREEVLPCSNPSNKKRAYPMMDTLSIIE
jgi:hypothetical protein